MSSPTNPMMLIARARARGIKTRRGVRFAPRDQDHGRDTVLYNTTDRGAETDQTDRQTGRQTEDKTETEAASETERDTTREIEAETENVANRETRETDIYTVNVVETETVNVAETETEGTIKRRGPKTNLSDMGACNARPPVRPFMSS
jgi:hypothetical protein